MVRRVDARHYAGMRTHAKPTQRDLIPSPTTPSPLTLAPTTGARRSVLIGRQAPRPTPTISAVIPTLNEAANLGHVLPRIPDCVTELIIVDGHSTDDTIRVAKELAPHARIVTQSGRGKGNALACGFAAATGDIIVMLDADGSTDPAEIPTFIAPLLAGFDFVKGSRFMTDGASTDITPIRRMGNRFLGGTVNLLFGTSYTDLCYGYNAFHAHCLDHMHVTCDGFEVETLINTRIARAGLKVTEVPSTEHERIHGESKLNAIRDGLRVLRTIMRERIRRNPADLQPGSWRPEYAEFADVAIAREWTPVSELLAA